MLQLTCAFSHRSSKSIPERGISLPLSALPPSQVDLALLKYNRKYTDFKARIVADPLALLFCSTTPSAHSALSVAQPIYVCLPLQQCLTIARTL